MPGRAGTEHRPGTVKTLWGVSPGGGTDDTAPARLWLAAPSIQPLPCRRRQCRLFRLDRDTIVAAGAPTPDSGGGGGGAPRRHRFSPMADRGVITYV